VSLGTTAIVRLEGALAHGGTPSFDGQASDDRIGTIWIPKMTMGKVGGGR
jgi:hypothetical protein